MELDFRKLDVKKLYDFSKEEEDLICKIYDKLFEIYDIGIIDISNSPFYEFESGEEIPLFNPKICYFITDKNKENSFFLFIISKIEKLARSNRLPAQLESLQIWGMKKLNEDFGYISITKKKWADKIAGIFSRFNINFNDSDFRDFYVLASDKYKATAFLDTQRKELLRKFPDGDFNLEIKNNILSFGIPKNLSEKNAYLIAEFLQKV